LIEDRELSHRPLTWETLFKLFVLASFAFSCSPNGKKALLLLLLLYYLASIFILHFINVHIQMHSCDASRYVQPNVFYNSFLIHQILIAHETWKIKILLTQLIGNFNNIVSCSNKVLITKGHVQICTLTDLILIFFK